MNYLAHLLLSGNNLDIRFGNFIADALKGKQYEVYPKKIKEGVILHRAIDHFTDNHPIFKRHCKILYPKHSHYARVIMDVIYDYFLAKNWNKFHSQPLNEYTIKFYDDLASRENLIPPKMLRLTELMKSQNWLIQYSSTEGVTNILSQMSKRTRFPSQFDQAIETILPNQTIIENEFFEFFDELSLFCENHLISVQ